MIIPYLCTFDKHSPAPFSNSLSPLPAARRERKLLLTRTELRRLDRAVQEKGLTVVPLRLFINDRGLAKMEIALARGKKLYDKRESIKDKDIRRDADRAVKIKL